MIRIRSAIVQKISRQLLLCVFLTMIQKSFSANNTYYYEIKYTNAEVFGKFHLRLETKKTKDSANVFIKDAANKYNLKFAPIGQNTFKYSKNSFISIDEEEIYNIFFKIWKQRKPYDIFVGIGDPVFINRYFFPYYWAQYPKIIYNSILWAACKLSPSRIPESLQNLAPDETVWTVAIPIDKDKKAADAFDDVEKRLSTFISFAPSCVMYQMQQLELSPLASRKQAIYKVHIDRTSFRWQEKFFLRQCLGSDIRLSTPTYELNRFYNEPLKQQN